MFARSHRGTRKRLSHFGGRRAFVSACHPITIETPHDTTQAWIFAIPYPSRSKSSKGDSRSTHASDREDPGTTTEEAEIAILKEARLDGIHACLQRQKAWWKVDPVERRRMVMTRTSSRSIHPHLPHRSHPAIAGNSMVRGRYSPDCPTFQHSLNKPSRFCHSGPRPRDPSSRRGRTKHRRREKIGLEVHCVCDGQTIPPWS